MDRAAPTGAGILDLLDDGARGAATVRFEPSGVERATGELWADGERVARHLVARIGRGGSVAAFLTNTPDCPAGVFGVWRSGNTLVSLPLPGRGADLGRYAGQVVRMLELSGVGLVLVDAAYLRFVPPLPVPVATYQDVLAAGGPGCDVDGSGDLVQFTSGSLGTPRGVRLRPEALGANVEAILGALDIRPGDVGCTWLPMSHDMGFVGMFLACYSAAGARWGADRLVVQTPESFLADPASWLRLCAQTRATVTTAPNFAFELACRAAPMLRGIDLSAVRACITGAERVQAETLDRFTSTFAPAGLSPAAMCPAYGMAEASLAITLVRPADRWRELTLDRGALARGVLQPLDPLSAVETLSADQPRPVRQVGNGRPVDGMQVRVVDTDGSPVEGVGGGIGEVQIRGASLLESYVGTDLVTTTDGWFPTRDLGFLHDGELYLVGRSDETIIVGGQNHYAADIEAALHQHDDVRAGCLAAVAMDDGFALVAEPRGTPSASTLREACHRLALASARQAGVRPSLVAFVPPGALPKTPSGKLRRVPLAAALRAGELDLTVALTLEGAR